MIRGIQIANDINATKNTEKQAMALKLLLELFDADALLQFIQTSVPPAAASSAAPVTGTSNISTGTRNRFFDTVPPSSRLSSTTSYINEINSTRLNAFIPDIEGDKGYFNRFIQASRILDFEDMEPNLSPELDCFPYDKLVVFQHSMDV